MKHLTFYFNKQIIAVDIMSVQEIIGLKEMTQPCFKEPKFIVSWLNIRGRKLFVLDFRYQKIESSDKSCIIILRDQDHDFNFGLLVDDICEVLNISDDLSREALNSDQLKSVVQDTDTIKSMVTIDDENIWIMGPKFLNAEQARKLYELYQ